MTMTRRFLLSGLTACLAALRLRAQNPPPATENNLSPQRRWYITGGRRNGLHQSDCYIEPILTYGRDRLEAVANSGITVWSAEEWELERPRFEAMCKAYREKHP